MISIYLKLIFMRSIGHQSHRYDKRWDALVNKILDEGEHLSTDKYSGKYIYQGHEYSIWIANGLFSMGDPFVVKGEYVDDEMKYLPSIRTTARVYKEVYLPWTKSIKSEIEQKKNELFS